MNTFLPFIVIGLTAGSVYAISGVGIVLTYKTTGVFNFAHGSVAAFSVLLFYFLHVEHGISWPVAAILCVLVFAPLTGLVLEYVARRVVGASATLSTVASLGIFLTMLGLGKIWYGDKVANFPDFLPTNSYSIGGVFVGADQIITMTFSLVAALALALLLQSTRTGAALRGVVDNPELVALSGVNPARIRRLAWVLGSMFASASGLLLAPGVGLSVVLLTLLVVQAFGAAAIGWFSSFGATYAGGLAIGVLGALSTKYSASVSFLAGLPSGLPFIVLLIALLVVPRRKLTARRFLPTIRVRSSWHAPTPVRIVALGSTVILLGIVPALFGSELAVWSHGLTDFIIFLSLGFLVHTTGQLSLCQLSFAAIGASAMGHFAGEQHLPWFLALVLAGLVALPVGALVAYPASRLPSVFLAVATFGFGVLLEQMFFTQNWMFGFSAAGLSVPRPHLSVGPWNAQTDTGYFYLLLVMAALAVTLILVLSRSRFGRLLRGLADSPQALAASGTEVAILRAMAFCFSAVLASTAGALSAGLFHFAIASQFNSIMSLQMVVVVVIIVIGEPWYAAIAALTSTVLPTYLPLHNVDSYLLLLFGLSAATFAMQLNWLPRVPLAAQRYLSRFTWPDRRENSPSIGRAELRPAPTAVAGSSGAGLEIEHLTVRFGGIVAVNDVALVAPRGQITGLIGPNGAGKSTTFEACAGRAAASAGHVHLHGRRINRLSVAQRAGLGLGRTMQRAELYESLSVRDNVALSMEARRAGRSPLRQLFARRSEPAEVSSRTESALETVGLADHADRTVGALSTGQKRLVELARCLAGGFDVWLMDEPSSGLDDNETRHFGRILEQVVDREDIAILLVEHDMQLVRAVCSSIYVLDFGTVIGRGPTAAVLASDSVQRAYIGYAPAPSEAGVGLA